MSPRITAEGDTAATAPPVHEAPKGSGESPSKREEDRTRHAPIILDGGGGRSTIGASADGRAQTKGSLEDSDEEREKTQPKREIQGRNSDLGAINKEKQGSENLRKRISTNITGNQLPKAGLNSLTIRAHPQLNQKCRSEIKQRIDREENGARLRNTGWG